jgi:hypothetical protein
MCMRVCTGFEKLVRYWCFAMWCMHVCVCCVCICVCFSHAQTKSWVLHLAMQYLNIYVCECVRIYHIPGDMDVLQLAMFEWVYAYMCLYVSKPDKILVLQLAMVEEQLGKVSEARDLHKEVCLEHVRVCVLVRVFNDGAGHVWVEWHA